MVTERLSLVSQGEQRTLIGRGAPDYTSAAPAARQNAASAGVGPGPDPDVS